MKFKVMIFDKRIMFLLILFSIALFTLIYNIYKYEHIKNINRIKESKISETNIVKKVNNNINIKDATNKLKNDIISDSIEVKEYAIMPQYIQNYLVIGELQIPSINLDTYILNDSSDKALNVSVTKLTGPNINTEGNFCITGHNYLKENMFGKLKKVNNGDRVILIDTFGRQKEYVVYDKLEVEPSDVSVLNQDTNGKREVTLITCTTGAIKRVVIKAREV